MVVVLNKMQIYEVADSLAMNISADAKTGELTGLMKRTIVLGDLALTVPVKIVSSMHGTSTMAMATVIGNLGMLVTVAKAHGGFDTQVHLLDQAKMDTIAGWLEKHRPATPSAAVVSLGDAVTASFRKKSKSTWARI